MNMDNVIAIDKTYSLDHAQRWVRSNPDLYIVVMEWLGRTSYLICRDRAVSEDDEHVGRGDAGWDAFDRPDPH